jgi:short-subunit dehydrogenase
VAGDITDATTLQQIQHAARAMAMPLNLLINNAGVNEFHEFETQDEATVLRILNVNLYSSIALSQRLLPLLKSAIRAQIVNVGSMLGYIGYPGYAAYCASKFGLRGFSEALRRELSDTGVRVRYFAPRTTATPLNPPAVSAMHRDLGTAHDTPRLVADRLIGFIGTDAGECPIGFPDRFYAFLNRLLPSLTDRAIAGQLGVIRKYLPARRPSP